MAVKKLRRIRILPDLNQNNTDEIIYQKYTHLIDLAKHKIHRQYRDTDRKHQTQSKQVEKQILAAELKPRKNKSSHTQTKTTPAVVTNMTITLFINRRQNAGVLMIPVAQ